MMKNTKATAKSLNVNGRTYKVERLVASHGGANGHTDVYSVTGKRGASFMAMHFTELNVLRMLPDFRKSSAPARDFVEFNFS